MHGNKTNLHKNRTCFLGNVFSKKPWCTLQKIKTRQDFFSYFKKKILDSKSIFLFQDFFLSQDHGS